MKMKMPHKNFNSSTKKMKRIEKKNSGDNYIDKLKNKNKNISNTLISMQDEPKIFVIKNKLDLIKESSVHESNKSNDICDEKSKSKKKKRSLETGNKIILSAESKEELEDRTIYVGNVKATGKKVKLGRFFSKYGPVESVRFRGIAPKSMEMSKKEAISTKQLHKDRPTIIAYIRFRDKESKTKALSANGELLNGLHLCVDHAVPQLGKEKDNYAVFVGNLPWEVQDEELWDLFSSCGRITNVRIVRSATTGASKGFGYVSFNNKDAIEAAMNLEGSVIRKRPIRVKREAKKEKIVANGKKMRRSGVASLLNPIGKGKPKMNLDFLKNDKPLANRLRIENRQNKKKLKKLNKSSNSFSGSQYDNETETKAKKSKKNRNKMERSQRRCAKIIEAKGK